MSNAPSKPVSFSRPKVGYFSNRPRICISWIIKCLRSHRLDRLSRLARYFFPEIGSVLHFSQTSSKKIRAKALTIPSPRQSVKIRQCFSLRTFAKHHAVARLRNTRRADVTSGTRGTIMQMGHSCAGPELTD